MTRIDSPKPQMPDGAERRPSLHRLLRVGLAGFVLLAVAGGAIALGATDEPTAETIEPSGSAAAVPTSDSRVDPPQTTTTWGPSATPGVESTPVPESTIPAEEPKLVAPPVSAPSAVGADLATVTDGVGPDGKSYGSIGQAAPGTDLRTLTPDYVTVSNPDGTLAGYFKSSEMYPPTGAPALIDTKQGVPVYAADGTTVVGHITREHGYVPIGVNPDDLPPIGGYPDEGGQ